MTELALADHIVETAAAAVEAADLVILCAPVGAMGAIAQEIGPHLLPGAIVSDVGSVKTSIVKAVAPYLPGKRPIYPRASRGGNRGIGTGGRIFDAFPESLDHIDAARRD